MAKIKTSSKNNGEVVNNQLSHIIQIEELLRKIANNKGSNSNILGSVLPNSMSINSSNEQSKDDKKQSKTDKQLQQLLKGLNSKKPDDEKYGAIKKDSPETKILREIAANTKEQSKVTVESKKEEEKGGLLSKIMGFAGKLLFPMIAGLILSALKPGIKELLKNFLGGNGGWSGAVGDFLGNALGDMIPGAVGGLMAAKKFGLSPVQGALIGATISYAGSKLLGIIEDVVNMFKGKPREGAGEANGYLEKALGGAMIGASLMKWKKGSLQAAFLGAGIGIAAEWILNRANEMRGLLTGDSVEIKKIPGVDIPEAVAGGLIGGAMLGHRIGGFKGALWGAVIGGTAGAVVTLITDFNNRFQAAKKGEYKEPTTICGIPAAIFTGIVAGAAIGGKFGGPVGGLIGAAVGGIAGAIYNWGTNLYNRNKATDASGKKLKDEKLKDNKIVQGANAETDKIKEEQAKLAKDKEEIDKKLASGEITEEEAEKQKKEIKGKEKGVADRQEKVKKFNSDLERRLGHVAGVKKEGSNEWEVSPMDLNNDGKVTKEELAQWKEKNGATSSLWNPNSWGTQGRTARRMEKLMKENPDGVSLDKITEESAKRAKLDTKSTPTKDEITSNKLLKEQGNNQKRSIKEQEKTNELLERIATATDQQVEVSGNDGNIDTQGNTSGGQTIRK